MIKCNLADIRVKKMISQKKLSDQLGIRLATISSMENKEQKTYSSETLNALCSYLNCTLSDLLEYVPDDGTDTPKPITELLSDDELELLNCYRALSDNNKVKCLHILQTVCSELSE